MASPRPTPRDDTKRVGAGRLRGVAQRGAFLAILFALGALLLRNIDQNLADRGLSLSFDFLARPAGFEIAIKAINFTPRETYAAAALVGIANTLLVSALAIITATIVGFAAGAMLLSSNPILARSTQGFTELIRNTPQLLQILFVYTVILRALPSTRDSLSIAGWVFLNVRGLFIPAILADPAAMPRFGIEASEAAWICLATLVVWAFLPLPRRWKMPVAGGLLIALAGLIGLMLQSGALRIETPTLRGFNFRGGVQVAPELVSLWIGLAVYAGFAAAVLMALQLPALGVAFVSSSEVVGVLAAGGLICLVGVLDDRFDLVVERKPDGTHRIHFHPTLDLPNDPREATAVMTAAIEQQIRRHPEQWVWWHKRWRRQPE